MPLILISILSCANNKRRISVFLFCIAAIKAESLKYLINNSKKNI